MLLPKKIKFRKWHKGRRTTKGKESRGTKLLFGSFGLRAKTESWVSSKQIEAARRAIAHQFQKGGKVWIRIFPDKPVTAKGPEQPMGHGKGAPDRYVTPIKPGRIIFEIDGVSETIARKALRLAAHKLPLKADVISR